MADGRTTSSPITVRMDGGRLVVSASAGCAPALGVFFLVVFGILVYGLSGGFVNLHEVSATERAIAWVVGLSGLGVGAWVLHTTRGHRAVFDPVRRTVIVERRAPFHTARQELRIAEVLRSSVERKADSDGDPVYGIVLELMGGLRASLTPHLYPDRVGCDRAVEEINRFLDAQR